MRVLRDDGQFCVCVVHPVRDAGSFVSDEGDAPFSISDSYFEARLYDESIERDGLQMTFTSWRYSLERYAGALEDAGFLIERVREPAPDELLGDRRWERSQVYRCFSSFARPSPHEAPHGVRVESHCGRSRHWSSNSSSTS
jgi:hypothetical protein